MHKYLLLIGILLSVNLAFAGTNKSTFTEYGLLDDVVNGQYGNLVTVNDVAKQNNFGLGAGIGLGELIILDGKFYLANPHGKIHIATKNDYLSWVTATQFKPQQHFVVKGFANMEELQTMLGAYTNKHEIYAIKLTGVFTKIKGRSENIDNAPYTPLVPWMKTNQNLFDYNNKPATIVAFLVPDSLSQLGVKFHAHFVSKDETIGGHVLDLSGQNIVVEIEPLTNANLVLRTNFDPVKSVKGGAQAYKLNSVEAVSAK